MKIILFHALEVRHILSLQGLKLSLLFERIGIWILNSDTCIT